MSSTYRHPCILVSLPFFYNVSCDGWASNIGRGLPGQSNAVLHDLQGSQVLWRAWFVWRQQVNAYKYKIEE